MVSIYAAAAGICGVCQEYVSPDDFHVDHIVPLARGGSDTIDNMQIAHPDCNRRKNTFLLEELAHSSSYSNSGNNRLTPDGLRAWRKAHGYSMRRLAEALDLHYYSFYRWEKGITPMPGRWLDLALERLACEDKPRATTRTEGDE